MQMQMQMQMQIQMQQEGIHTEFSSINCSALTIKFFWWTQQQELHFKVYFNWML